MFGDVMAMYLILSPRTVDLCFYRIMDASAVTKKHRVTGRVTGGSPRDFCVFNIGKLT
jgi:hypothetical protein